MASDARDPAASARHDAAIRLERGIELYASGKYAAALAEMEGALAAVPNHPRALECVAWVRDVAAGRHVLQSGGYATVAEDEPASPPALGLLRSSDAIARTQLDDAPESVVTSEWSSMATGLNLPQLDVPELSEEQIANLLELEGNRGITLSKGGALLGAAATSVEIAQVPDPEPEQYEELGRTSVLLPMTPQDSGPYIEQIVEFTAEAEDDTPLPGAARRPVRDTPAEPVLSPWTASNTSMAAQRPLDQLADDPPPTSTNPYVQHRSKTPHSGVRKLPDPTEASSLGAASSATSSRAALQRRAFREAFDTAEMLVEARGGIDAPALSGDLELVFASYAAIIGDLTLIPSHGKASPGLDSRSAFLLSRMDGSTSADDLLDVSGMPRGQALRILAKLVASGVVTMRK